MRKLSMSMCASRDYMQGYNKAVDDGQTEMEAIRKVVDAAIAVVKNQAWSGICDEDVNLELALKEAGEI